jgi:hypothetical protein
VEFDCARWRRRPAPGTHEHEHTPGAPPGISFRWAICALLFAAKTFSHVDRQARKAHQIGIFNTSTNIGALVAAVVTSPIALELGMGGTRPSCSPGLSVTSLPAG